MSEYAHLKSNVLSPNFKRFGHILTFFQVVVSTGYPFFQWNGRVYEVVNMGGWMEYRDTGKMIEDFE